MRSAVKFPSGIRAIAYSPFNSTMNSDDGFQLGFLLRITQNDPGGEMTWIDFPVSLSLSTPKDGSITLDLSLNVALQPLIGGGLTGQSEISIVFADLRDPDSDTFMHVGVR